DNVQIGSLKDGPHVVFTISEVLTKAITPKR
ncbi:hypothetical protein V3C99_013792, partial [Haemonchus contortus]|uniref:50S ribosomal protein L25 n=1 Tax=Haemonchus contortus TaxID=6289 RepID=A0A7I4YQI6_HAECO